ncbi:tyrosine-type recombinase/integrase [Thermodesulfobacteriota bacterium]
MLPAKGQTSENTDLIVERTDEVANLYISDLDLKRNRIFIRNGKGRKDRVVYVSRDAYEAIVNYLRVRPFSKAKKPFGSIDFTEPTSLSSVSSKVLQLHT